jgi:hypothetical protein
MSVDDDIEIIGSKAGSVEIGQQAMLEIIDAPHLVWYFVAGSGVDEDGVIAGADYQGIHRGVETVLRVGGKLLLPHRFWDDAKHGAAVEIVEAIGKDGEFEIAKRSAVQRHAPCAVKAKG